MSYLRLTGPFIILFTIFILPITHFIYLLAPCISIFLNFIFGFVHTYPNILENGHFFRFRKIIFARPNGNAKTMEKRKHTIQGMRCIMYDIIVFENLRFLPSTPKG